MFQGRFIHTVDDKGRISIPAEFRVKLQGRQKGKAKPPTLTVLRDCLALFPAEDWQRMQDDLHSARGIDPRGQALRRFVMSHAYECPIDGPGRIKVPPHLREYASLEREVAIAGVGKYIELWNKARYEEEMSKVRSNFDDLSLGLAQSRD